MKQGQVARSRSSSSSLFNDESAPYGLSIYRQVMGTWQEDTVPPLGPREPTPLGVQGRPVTISQNRWRGQRLSTVRQGQVARTEAVNSEAKTMVPKTRGNSEADSGPRSSMLDCRG